MLKSTAPLLSRSLRRGVLAALATPVCDDGRPDLAAFARLLDFVAERGVDGIVVGGATGEYASYGLEQRATLIHAAARRSSAEFAVLAGIGAQTLAHTLRLAKVAADAACRAVLLPMPYFFRYSQEDLIEYARVVCDAAGLPCLLYHLPSFTNALELDSLAGLLESDAGFAGIKDSSGQSSHIPALLAARSHRPFDLFVGDDSLALDGIRAGWDGVISGIACFLPELLVSLLDAHRRGDSATARRRQDDLDRVIEELARLPIPWAVRIGLEERSIPVGPLPLPPSPLRTAQVEAFRNWFREWLRGKDWTRRWAQAESRNREP